MLPETLHSIHHDGSPRYVVAKPNLTIGDEVRLRLRAAPDAPVERILLRSAPDGEQHFTEMQPAAEQAGVRWWQASIRLSMPILAYRFLVFTTDGLFWYNGRGLAAHNPTDADDFRLLAGYHSPAWLAQAVFYQVFPDRFADGDPNNNVQTGEFTYRGQPVLARRWGESPAPGGLPAMFEFYGGDLPGIASRLEYLADLGVNALYLNPIFSAYSNHRYDVADYENVDPHLGGNAALAALRQKSAQAGIRLMLDIVPNHCGAGHPWFQAALANSYAPTAEFFTFHRHPDEYECWLGVRELPKLNYLSPALRQIMYAGPQAIFRHWLRPPYSIDGWRIDVANMLANQGQDQLGLEIARQIRQAVKEENPEAYLLGENFFDASPQLQGDCWDAVMNYSGFTIPLWNWLSRTHLHIWPERIPSPLPWSTRALLDTWQTYRAAIPWAIARQQFNLLGSHDTMRILTLMDGDPARARLAAALLLTYPGVPSIYYGDEVGLAGDSSQARACMPWEPQRWDADLRSFYRFLIHLRRSSPALTQGGFQTILAEQDTLAYLRDAETEQIIVVGHRGPAARPASPIRVAQAGLPNGAELVELLSQRRAVVSGGKLPLPELPPGVMIWRWKSG
jgi:alpha-glucosidase